MRVIERFGGRPLLSALALVATLGPARARADDAAPIEVTVHGAKPNAQDIGAEDLSGKNLHGIAGTFGDPLEAIGALPGVASTASGLAYFYVRGAPPADTGYFLDGIPLPALFHIGPGASVLPPPLVGNFEFFPGASPARYGRSVGGTIAATTAAPSPTPTAEAAAGLFEANAFVESPVDAKTTAMVAGRFGYPNVLLKIFAPDVSLSYWDYSARVTRALTPVDLISIFALGASDQEHDEAEQLTPVSSQFHRFDLRYDHRWTGGSLRVATTFGLDRTAQQLDGGSSELAAQTSGRLRTELEQELGTFGHLSAGADLNTMHNLYTFSGSPLKTLDIEQLGGSYVDLKLRPVSWVEIVPGIRLDAYRSPGVITPAIDPRLGARVAFGPHSSVRSITTVGIAHQEPTLGIPSPGLRLDASQGLQRVIQLSEGIEADLPLKITASLTGFYNLQHNMSDLLFDCGTLAATCSIVQRVDGQAFGLEVLVKRSLTERLSGWLAYTLSRVQHRLGNVEFLSPFDRTHVFSGVLRYDFGKGYEAGLRATYYSGRPETPNFLIPGTMVDYSFGPTQFPQHRLPDFYRIDVRGEKRWSLGGRRWIAAVVEFFNVTLQKEALDYQCSPETLVCDAQRIGPVSLPSIGVEGGF